MPADPSALTRTFTPWSLGTLRLPHRVVVGSMHTGLEMRDDGGEGLAAFYRERIEGGAALIVTGGLAVSPEGRGGPDYAVLSDPQAQERLAYAVGAAHEAGGAVAAQLFHAGRYAVLDGLVDDVGAPARSVAPSALPWRAAHGEVPRALGSDEAWEVIEQFATAAATAKRLGFDAVEVMASEGYLINQFCSPVTNLREDEWGGDGDRRSRFAIETLRAVRVAVGDLPVTVRISGDDLMPQAPAPHDYARLAVRLATIGADAISVGIGWHESRVPTVQAAVPHGAWLSAAEGIVSALREAGEHAAVIASNRFTDLRDAETVLQRGTVDAIALARPFLADPQLIQRSRGGAFSLVNTCIGCDQACIDRSLVFEPVSCLVNPRAGRESQFPLVAARSRARIAVVGGGPAGMASALDLARRGHDVTLFEAADALGGQFALAARIPGKEDYAATPRAASEELSRLGARLELGAAATADDLAGFDGVVLATGVRPRVVDIPGAELPHVLDYERAIQHGVPAGKVVIVGGGGIGVDVATMLVEPADARVRASGFAPRFGLPWPADVLEAKRGNWANRPGDPTAPGDATAAASRLARPGSDVTILRRSGKFGQGVGITARWVVLGALRDAGVRMINELTYRRITPEGVEIARVGGQVELLPADAVVVCAGQEAHDPLGRELAERGIRFEVVGGARDASRVDAVRATSEGLVAARRLAP
ncbi:FAD-dependent oxidoreductase [Humibacter albus]|uniref:FAD-dependent oxidoreductase n=1 Tax=Humibacter albus TaxID=427754 RepID=UPI0003B6F002|nr:FAD-dependent oxidoreductase [Humibacter albus]